MSRPHRAQRTASRRQRRVTGRFAPSSVRPLDVLIGFLLIQLKPTWSFLAVGLYSSPQLAAPYFSAVHALRCFVTPCNFEFAIMWGHRHWEKIMRSSVWYRDVAQTECIGEQPWAKCKVLSTVKIHGKLRNDFRYLLWNFSQLTATVSCHDSWLWR